MTTRGNGTLAFAPLYGRVVVTVLFGSERRLCGVVGWTGWFLQRECHQQFSTVVAVVGSLALVVETKIGRLIMQCFTRITHFLVKLVACLRKLRDGGRNVILESKSMEQVMKIQCNERFMDRACFGKLLGGWALVPGERSLVCLNSFSETKALSTLGESKPCQAQQLVLEGEQPSRPNLVSTISYCRFSPRAPSFAKAAAVATHPQGVQTQMKLNLLRLKYYPFWHSLCR